MSFSRPIVSPFNSAPLILVRVGSDSAPAIDQDVRQGNFYRTAADVVTPADSASRTGTFKRTPADSAPASDTTARTIIYSRTAQDLAAPEDTRSYGGLVQRPVHAVFATSGGGFIGDWATFQVIGARQATDSVPTPTDVALRVGT